MCWYKFFFQICIRNVTNGGQTLGAVSTNVQVHALAAYCSIYSNKEASQKKITYSYRDIPFYRFQQLGVAICKHDNGSKMCENITA